MRAFVGIAAVLLAMGCGRDDAPKPDIQYEPDPKPPEAVPAEEVLKQADGLYYRAGEIHPFTGRTEAFHPDKTKRGEFGFRMGIPDGSWQEWHPNGNQRRKFHYISGKLDGECVEWHTNGKMKWRANFRLDQPHGDWNVWDATGLHALKRSYQNGLLVSEVMPVELMQRVTLITQLRDRFDRFVWQPELDAIIDKLKAGDW